MKFLHRIVIWQLDRLARQQARLRNLHKRICSDSECRGHIL